MSENAKRQLNKKTAKVISLIIYGGYGLACLYLHYMQSIQPLDEQNRYFQSDLPYHISMIVDDGWYYSLTAYVYQALYLLGGKSGALIAGFLAFVTTATAVLTGKILEKIGQGKDHPVSVAAGAVASNMVMAFFLPLAGNYRYLSYQNGNLWHNSTYLVMRLIGVVTMLYYIKTEKNYKEQFSLKDWIVLTVLLAVGTAIKPSFLTVFAPALALKLLWDLLHRVNFGRIFALGCTVLPSLGVMYWQNAVLFGSDTGNGFHIAPWYNFSLHADRPKVAVICSLVFPIVVAIFQVKRVFADKQYFFAWMMTGIGFLEALLLAETGTRSRDGNFLWGYLFAVYYIYVYSFRVWKEKLVEVRTNGKCAWKQWIPVILCGLVFVYQLYGGIYFFLRLLSGETYFMFH